MGQFTFLRYISFSSVEYSIKQYNVFRKCSVWNITAHFSIADSILSQGSCDQRTDYPHCWSILSIGQYLLLHHVTLIAVPSTVHKLFSVTQRSRLSQYACSQNSPLSSPLFLHNNNMMFIINFVRMTGAYKRTKLQIYSKHACIFSSIKCKDYHNTRKQITISKNKAK